MTDIVERLRQIGKDFEPARPSIVVLTEEAANEIERLRLFEHYSNGPIEGMVDDAVAYKKQNGKYPFED